MAQLIVRNVEEEVALALRKRAAASGRSAEAEHREILREALLPSRGFKDALLAIPDVGNDADFARTQDTGRDIDL